MDKKSILNIAVFCSGNGSNFQAIVNACKKRFFKAKIALMICDNPEAYAIRRAKKEGIKTLVLERAGFSSREAFESAITEALEKENINLICLAGYMRMLSHNFVAKYRNRILNIHPAILPTFKGTHAIKDAIDYGSKVTGVTVHFVNEDMDAGPVILQEPVKINPSDTEKSLAERIHKVEHKLYPKAIRLFTKGRLKLIGRKVKIIALAAIIFFAVLNFESEAMYGNDIVTAVPLTLPIINQEIRPHITESIPVKEESPRPSLTAQYEKLGLVSYPLYDTKEPTSLKKDNNLMNAKLSIERPLTKEEIENMRIENSFKAARVVAEVMDSINAKGVYDGINGLIETAAKIIKFRNTLKTKYNLHFRIDKDEALLRYKKSF